MALQSKGQKCSVYSNRGRNVGSKAIVHNRPAADVRCLKQRVTTRDSFHVCQWRDREKARPIVSG